MSDSKIVKAPFVSMSEIRKNIGEVDPADPKIIESIEEDDDSAELENITEESQEETAIDDDVIDGSVSILLEKAQDEADLIVREARDMAEQIREQARKQGYEEGRGQGTEAAQAELNKQRRILEQKAAQMDAAYEEMLKEAEPLMAEVIGDLVDNMVGHYASNKDVILFLVRLALSEISTYGSFIIKVAPSDYDYVLDRKDELDREVGDKITLELVKDSGLEPLDCVIETEYGSVDASLSLRRDSLKKELRLIADSLRRDMEE